jgi:hypothetical protein
VVFGFVRFSSSSVVFRWEMRVSKKRVVIRKESTKISGRKIENIFCIIDLNSKKNLILVGV